MKSVFLIIIIHCVVSVIRAQSPDFQSTGYGVGAAAYLQLPDNASSAATATPVAWKQRLTWNAANPALMDGVEPYALSATWMALGNDRNHVTATIMGSIADLFGLGFSINSFGIKGFEFADEYGNRSGTFNDDETALCLTFSGRLRYSIVIAGAVRYLNQQLETGRANGFGADVGALWEGIPGVTIGISAQNLGSVMWWNTGKSDDVLPVARLGVQGILLDSTLRVACQFSKTSWWPVDGSVSAEYIMLKTIALRGGMQSSVLIDEQQVRWPDFSVGAGFHYGFFGFDYAMVIPASELGLRHVFTLQINVDKMMMHVVE